MQITLQQIINEVNKEKMTEKTADLLDGKITDIRIELLKGVDKGVLDKLLYELTITVFKQIKDLNEIEVIDHQEIKPNENE